MNCFISIYWGATVSYVLHYFMLTYSFKVIERICWFSRSLNFIWRDHIEISIKHTWNTLLNLKWQHKKKAYYATGKPIRRVTISWGCWTRKAFEKASWVNFQETFRHRLIVLVWNWYIFNAQEHVHSQVLS